MTLDQGESPNIPSKRKGSKKGKKNKVNDVASGKDLEEQIKADKLKKS